MWRRTFRGSGAATSGNSLSLRDVPQGHWGSSGDICYIREQQGPLVMRSGPL